jgi:predicted helicase
MKMDSIKTIKDFKSLAHFLAEELSWPIDPNNVDVDDLVFEYQPEDIGLSDEFAAKVQAIKQIRPLEANQPWSIFWIDFENKKIPLTVLRRILNVFVTKKRGNTRNIATKQMEDIMFVSGHGEDKNRAITFAHFKRLDDVETIREFYWDGHETKFDHIASYLEKLEWPTNTADVDGWRMKWKAAFTGSTREAITTSDQLAQAMANIAKNIRDRVLEVLEIEPQSGPVHKLYDTFRAGLVHDMTEKGFADMYAQTITYGLFSARTMDTDGHFELHEVIDLIPTTNPFLKNLFRECLSTGDKNHKIDLDELGVGRLVDLFDNLNKSDGTDAMQRILAEFGRQTFSGQEDPVIHFYEGFLKEYDSLQRIEKGVYYTPDPVVKFIVRSVNEELKSEFGLEYGLADTITWAEMVSSGRAEYPVDPNTGKVNKDWIDKIKGRAFVQILDPATGTGTFLKHVIEVILEEVKLKFKKEQISGSWQDYWNNYVYNSLLPRIYGFELMMASYSVAHMKLGMFLKSTGYKFEKDQRLNIYLTNSLEPYTANNSANLFFTSVGAESSGANEVKKNRFFSVIIGNPPYSGESKNRDPWIMGLMDDYKMEPGGKEKLKERNPKWINDDYVKFIRFGQYCIEKNETGILAFINPHGFLDNPTFRGVRWNLLNKYNRINTIDLHGNSKKKETAPDGSIDENVFDIMQGVSINFFLKTGMKKGKEFATLFHYDLFGKREIKYDFLNKNSASTIDYNELKNISPNYFFVNKNFHAQKEYENGFKINDLFVLSNVGIVTSRDSFVTSDKKDDLINRIKDFFILSKEDILTNYDVQENNVWKIHDVKQKAKTFEEENITTVSYRPFDLKYIYYDNNFIERSRTDTMQHFIKVENIGMVFKLGNSEENSVSAMVSKYIIDFRSWSRPGMQGGDYIAPLYLYPITKIQQTIEQSTERKPNFNTEILENIADKLKLNFTNEKELTKDTFAPIDILDYIYAILHSPNYRYKYKEFLKIDFPSVPYPKDKIKFWELVKLGREIRQIHLLESDVINNSITQYPIKGDDLINKKASFDNGKVWINKTQYFDNVPQVAWEFFIGGYQPAQKWLKDRKDRVLSKEDINHYQKIIVVLTETHRLMKEIDTIDFMENDDVNIPIKKYSNNDEHYSLVAEPEN